MSQEEKVHLRDFVWMKPPDGGEPVQVPVEPHDPNAIEHSQIGQHMAQGYVQIFPAEEKKES